MDSSLAGGVNGGTNKTQCPKCHCTVIYSLSDGRHMCKQCRTKYTPVQRLGRLDSALVGVLASRFWSMTPLDTTANLLEINRKTVQRYFGTIRNCIAKHCEDQACRASTGREPDALFVGEWRVAQLELERKDTVTVFGLYSHDNAVRLVFARSWSDWSGLDLSSLRIQTRPPHKYGAGELMNSFDSLQGFWQFAHSRLGRYRGGFMKRFPLYLREMEFRYNHRHDPLAVQKIMHYLDSGPN